MLHSSEACECCTEKAKCCDEQNIGIAKFVSLFYGDLQRSVKADGVGAGPTAGMG